jgi:hypothetical protein
MDKIKYFFRKNHRIMVFGSLLIVTIIVACFLFYLYVYSPRHEKETKKSAPRNITGQDLVAYNGIKEGTPPFKPILSAEISGDYKSSESLCQWFVDGTEMIQKTKPVDGKCVLDHIGLESKGVYKIHYKIVGTSFTSKDYDVTVK